MSDQENTVQDEKSVEVSGDHLTDEQNDVNRESTSRRASSKRKSSTSSRSRSRSASRRSSSRKKKRRRHRRRSTSRSRSDSRSRSRSGSRHRRRRLSHSRSRSRSQDRRYPGGRSNGHFGGMPDNPNPSRCVGVFGLSLYTDERTLDKCFSKFGHIDKLQIIYDKMNKRSRGFAFVYYDRLEDAIEAKDRANGTEIDGQKIRVDFSLTNRAHTPTPGMYMGRREQRNSPTFRRRSRSRSRGRY